MRTLILDFETYHDPEFNLKKLPTAAYVRDPRFGVLGLGVQESDKRTWYTADAVGPFLRSINWADATVVGHNLKFDGSILNHCYGAIPARYVDTLALAHAILGRTTGKFGLRDLATLYALPEKGDLAGLSLSGVRRPTPEQDALLAEYCLRDVEITAELYKRLWPEFPASQRIVLDWTIRTFTDPTLVVDPDALSGYRHAEAIAQEAVFTKLGLPRGVFASSEKFAELLRAEGVEPPTKISARTKKSTLALSKTDKPFTDLGKHPSARVRDLVEARLISKSTIKVTRADKMMVVATTGPYPFDVEFSGAMQTHRFSGGNGGGGNPQNVPKGPGIRDYIRAPKGCLLVVGDFAKIEVVLSAFGCKEPTLMRLLAGGGDPYCDLATRMFGRPITKDDKSERAFGKEGILGLGYGMGVKKFAARATMALKREVTPEEAAPLVATYRNSYARIPAMWNTLEELIPLLAAGGNGVIPGFPFLRIKNGEIILPSGLEVRYPNLRWVADGGFQGRGEWVYDVFERGRSVATVAHLYGGKVLEGLCQALAGELCKMSLERCLTAGLKPVGQVHDEILLSVPSDDASKAKELLERFMRVPPPWWPQLVLGCEVGIGESWLTAKS